MEDLKRTQTHANALTHFSRHQLSVFRLDQVCTLNGAQSEDLAVCNQSFACF